MHYFRWRRHGDPMANKQVRTWEPVVEGPIARIPLTRGMWATADTADLPLLTGRAWAASARGNTYYATSNGRSGNLYMHRVILGVPGQVDHINRDGLDNRRANLRPATLSQQRGNAGQRRDAKSSRYKGVSWQAGRWRAMIAHQHIGRFDDEDEAARAYDDAARARWGDYARTNFPD